jgi:hypothetical protein
VPTVQVGKPRPQYPSVLYQTYPSPPQNDLQFSSLTAMWGSDFLTLQPSPLWGVLRPGGQAGSARSPARGHQGKSAAGKSRYKGRSSWAGTLGNWRSASQVSESYGSQTESVTPTMVPASA